MQTNAANNDPHKLNGPTHYIRKHNVLCEWFHQKSLLSFNFELFPNETDFYTYFFTAYNLTGRTSGGESNNTDDGSVPAVIAMQ